MPQLHFYVPDEVARSLRARARSLGLSLSRYLATLMRREIGEGWPEGYFDDIAGGWQGKPLRRPRQAGQDTQQARFARSVAPYEQRHGPSTDGQRDILENPSVAHAPSHVGGNDACVRQRHQSDARDLPC